MISFINKVKKAFLLNKDEKFFINQSFDISPSNSRNKYKSNAIFNATEEYKPPCFLITMLKDKSISEKLYLYLSLVNWSKKNFSKNPIIYIFSFFLSSIVVYFRNRKWKKIYSKTKIKHFITLNNYNIFKEIKKTFYYCSLSLDGKSFSNFANFFLSAQFKYGISYLFKFFFFKWSKPNFIYNYLVFNKFETFSSKNSLKKVEHLPTLLIKLANNLKLNLTPKNNYFYEIKKNSTKKSNKIFKNKIKSKFILMHLDEKWKDISKIDLDFSNELIIFQKKIRKKIVLTSNKNNFLYYKELKKKFLLKII